MLRPALALALVAAAAARGLRIGLERAEGRHDRPTRRRARTTTRAAPPPPQGRAAAGPRSAPGQGRRLPGAGLPHLAARRQAAALHRRAGGRRSSSSAAASPQAQPFLDIRSKVTAGGEQGLLSMAFAPDYAQSGLFYVYYTEKSGSEAIWEYRRAGDDRADPNSARLVLRMDDPEPNHNGGLMIFGSDKLMYVGTGDGGGGNDQHGTRGNAQSLSSPLGKILRIDPRRSGGKAVHDPVLEPVRRARGRPRRDLLLRAAQPVALLVRQRHRRPRHRRRRAGRGRGDRLRQEGRRARRELRLAPVGGPPAQLRRAGAARDLPRHHAHPPGRLLLDHGRLRRARPRRARRSTGATSTATTATAACAWPRLRAGRRAQSRTLLGAARLGRRVVRRGRLGAPLRGLAQRAGLPLRGALTGSIGGTLA